MPINNGIFSPCFSTRSIFLCPLATCNQRYYLPTTLPVPQFNIVWSQYPRLYSQLDDELTTKLQCLQEFLSQGLHYFYFKWFFYISGFLSHFSKLWSSSFFCSFRRCFSPINTTAIIPMESIGIPLRQQVRCSHNTDGNKTQFCLPCCIIAFGTSLSTMYI